MWNQRVRRALAPSLSIPEISMRWLLPGKLWISSCAMSCSKCTIFRAVLHSFIKLVASSNTFRVRFTLGGQLSFSSRYSEWLPSRRKGVVASPAFPLLPSKHRMNNLLQSHSYGSPLPLSPSPPSWQLHDVFHMNFSALQVKDRKFPGHEVALDPGLKSLWIHIIA